MCVIKAIVVFSCSDFCNVESMCINSAIIQNFHYTHDKITVVGGVIL